MVSEGWENAKQETKRRSDTVRTFKWITVKLIVDRCKVKPLVPEKQYPIHGNCISRIRRNRIYISMTHLDEQELATYVEALLIDEQGQLPEHVEECLECKMEIMEVWELIEAVERLPMFDNSSKQ